MLCEIYGCQILLPGSPRSLSRFVMTDRVVVACSGRYAGVLMGEDQDCKVAVKVLRMYSISNLDKIIIIGVGRRPKFAKILNLY